jgi:hypothetical protein
VDVDCFDTRAGSGTGSVEALPQGDTVSTRLSASIAPEGSAGPVKDLNRRSQSTQSKPEIPDCQDFARELDCRIVPRAHRAGTCFRRRPWNSCQFLEEFGLQERYERLTRLRLRERKSPVPNIGSRVLRWH